MKIKLFFILLFTQSIVWSQISTDFYSANCNIYKQSDSVTSLCIEKFNDSIVNILPYLINLENLTIYSEFDTLELSESVFVLKKLKYLKLSGYFYSISPKMKKLKNLRILEISNSRNKNILPPEIKYLINLEVLNIKGVDTIIPEIFNLNKLSSLTLVGDFASLPPDIKKLKELKFLWLIAWNLKIIPENIGKLNKLETLIIEYSQIKGLPKQICKLKKLKTIIIQFSVSLEYIPNCIRRMKNLEKVNIGYNNIPEKIKKKTTNKLKKKKVKVYIQ